MPSGLLQAAVLVPTDAKLLLVSGSKVRQYNLTGEINSIKEPRIQIKHA
jgi:hypothetical protein